MSSKGKSTKPSRIFPDFTSQVNNDMNNCRLETFYLFEEFTSSSFSYSKVAVSVFEELQKLPSSYVSHTTRLCHVKDSVLAVTEFQIKHEGDCNKIEILTSREDQYDDVALMEPSIVCAIVDTRLLTAYDDRFRLARKPWGCLVTESHGNLFECDISGSSLTRSLYCPGDKFQTRTTTGLGNDRRGFVNLQVKSFNPGTFANKTPDPIIAWGMKLSEVFRLELQCQSSKPLPTSLLVVTRVTTELLEVASYKGREQKSFCAEAPKSLYVWLLLEKRCFEKLGRPVFDTDTVFQIPSGLYNGTLPTIEPTSYSQLMARIYAIKFVVEFVDLKDEFDKQSLEAIVDVNIAKIYSEDTVQDMDRQLHVSSSSESASSHERIYFADHDGISIDVSMLQRELLGENGSSEYLIERWQVWAFPVDHQWISITGIKYVNAEAERYLAKIHRALLVRNANSEAAIKFKFFKGWSESHEDIGYVFGMPMVTYKGRFTFTLPASLRRVLEAFYRGPAQTPSERASLVASLDSLFAIVSQGVRVSDFLKLQAVYALLPDEIPQDHFRKLSMKLLMEESELRSTGRVNTKSTKHAIGSIDLLLLHFQHPLDGSEVHCHFPGQFLSFPIPSVPPSYYSGSFLRQYTLVVDVWPGLCYAYVPIYICGERIQIIGHKQTAPVCALMKTKDDLKWCGSFREMGKEGPVGVFRDGDYIDPKLANQVKKEPPKPPPSDPCSIC